MEITPEEVIDRVRTAGGRLTVDDVDEDELAAWRHALKVAYLRLLRVGHERLYRSSTPGSLHTAQRWPPISNAMITQNLSEHDNPQNGS